MSVAREIRDEQKKALKDMTIKEKFLYFWDYYRTHTIAVIAGILIIVTLVRDISGNKDYNFYAMMLNAYGLDSAAVSDDFAAFADLDTENFQCYVDTTSGLNPDSMTQYDIATTQVIMAHIQTNDLDVFTADQTLFTGYARNEMFADLRTVLTADELAHYEGKLFYIDGALYEAEEEDSYDLETEAARTKEQVAAITANCRNPENMSDPIPVGVFLNDAPFIVQTSAYPAGDAVFGIIVNTLRPETAKEYLAYLWREVDPEIHYNTYEQLDASQ